MKSKAMLVFALILMLFVLQSGPAAAKVVELKFSTAVPATSHWHIGADAFVKMIEERTGGRFKIRIFSSDELSGGNQVVGIQMLQQGSTDLHMHDALLWSNFNRKIAVPAFPFLLASIEEVDAVMEGKGGEAIKELVSQSGAVCLGLGEAGYRQIVNKKHPIKMPEDLKGLKLRVPGIAMYVDLFKILGADPIAMNQSEVYTSLQQGAIDGAENTVDLLITQNTLEVVKYITLWNYSYDPVIFTASERLWSSLSDEDKAIFKAAGEEAMAIQKAEKRKLDAQYIEKVKKDYGLDVVELSAEQIQAFKDAAAPIYEQYKEVIGTDLFETFGYTFK
jgi:tripartite ATP-independent transporter DctP family solute receptor